MSLSVGVHNRGLPQGLISGHKRGGGHSPWRCPGCATPSQRPIWPQLGRFLWGIKIRTFKAGFLMLLLNLFFCLLICSFQVFCIFNWCWFYWLLLWYRIFNTFLVSCLVHYFYDGKVRHTSDKINKLNDSNVLSSILIKENQ